MYRRVINIITVILIIILVSLSFLVGINFSKLSKDFNIGTTYDINNPPKYRFMVIIDGTDANYVKEMELGLSRAALDHEVVYEMWHFEGDNKEDDILRQFDIAIESNVDGIIIQAFDDERLSSVLSKSNYRGVPVTTIGIDIPTHEKVSFLSYNNYAIGSRIGNLLSTNFSEEQINSGTIVLLQDEDNSDQDKGLAIKEKLSESFVVKPVLINNQGEDTLNAEGVTRIVVNEYDDLVAIVCTTGDETLGVVQALKETNTINDVVVIGSDDYQEILDYIDRGTVFATVVPDNERLGYEAITHLVEYKNGAFVSQYKDIQVNIIEKATIETYMKEVGDRFEE